MPHLINDVTPQKELVIHTDGGSRGNPGPSAIGIVISTADNKHLLSYGQYIGITTNNQAEYQAVVDALETAAYYHPKKIIFYLDSELVVKQLKGLYKVKNIDLQPLHARIHELSRHLEISFNHVLRAKNTLADIEVNKALDDAALHGAW